uniref:HDC14703 n=1 Tax=Drosophila melanogaster TaxID=7227 RepID=Q6IJK7_DROME|nr:TPA_inf: HDC14703 [Drosophila melanogaster]
MVIILQKTCNRMYNVTIRRLGKIDIMAHYAAVLFAQCKYAERNSRLHATTWSAYGGSTISPGCLFPSNIADWVVRATRFMGPGPTG